MNQQLKFRVWGKSYGCGMFLYSYRNKGLSFSASPGDANMEVFGCFDLEQCLDFGFIVQQFTGLKDKNGKEIYEGDIVHSPMHWTKKPDCFVCEFNTPMFVFRKISDNKIWHWIEGSEKFTEVIGNIFENPELLKA